MRISARMLLAEKLRLFHGDRSVIALIYTTLTLPALIGFALPASLSFMGGWKPLTLWSRIRSASLATDERRSFWDDLSGLSFGEFVVGVTTFLRGIIEFTHIFYQWNAASKAVPFGARLAVVSRR
jgi:hypothetical protein